MAAAAAAAAAPAAATAAAVAAAGWACMQGGTVSTPPTALMIQTTRHCQFTHPNAQKHTGTHTPGTVVVQH